VAWSSAEITASEIALAAADKPILVATNVLDSWSNARWTTTGATNGTDVTDDDYPVRALRDRHAAVYTASESTAATQYINLALPSVEFDMCAIIGHNLAPFTTPQVDLQIADSADYSSNPATIATWTPTTSKRLVSLSLRHTGTTALRYSDVDHARLKFTAGATPFTPRVREVWLGQRIQLERNPIRPWNPEDVGVRAARFESDGGLITDYEYLSGRKAMSAELQLVGSERALAASFFAASRYGISAFLWLDKPGTDATLCYLMKRTDPNVGKTMPEVEYDEWRTSIEAVEQGGAYRSEEG
jgi:hypothetical protein